MNGKLTKPRLTVTLPEDLHYWFKLYTLKSRTTMKEIVTEMLKDLQRKEENNNQAVKQGAS